MKTKPCFVAWAALILVVFSLVSCAPEVPVVVNENKDQSTILVDYYTMESENLSNHVLIDQGKIRVHWGEIYYLDIYGSLWQWNVAPTSFPRVVQKGVSDFINNTLYLDTSGRLWFNGQVLMKDILKISSDNDTHYFIDSNHDLWVWGAAYINTQGSFLKEWIFPESPVKVTGDVVEVEPGVGWWPKGALILKRYGSVYAWGVLTRDDNVVKNLKLLDIDGKHLVRTK